MYQPRHAADKAADPLDALLDEARRLTVSEAEHEALEELLASASEFK